MAHARSVVAQRDLIAETSARSRPGLLRRFLDAMMQSRQRQAEIARYLQNNKFTDETEREIERLFLSPPPHF